MARELTDATLELLEDFTVAWLRGESPDPRLALERAPADERAGLSVLIDRFLATQPTRAPTEATLGYVSEIAAMADQASAEGDEPATAIAQLRVSHGLSVDAVVDRLRRLLGLGTPLTGRLREAYSDLERDWLDPRGVQRPVWRALTAILGTDVRELVLAEPQGPLEAVLMRKEPTHRLHTDVAGTEPEQRDEVDELFRGRPPTEEE